VRSRAPAGHSPRQSPVDRFPAIRPSATALGRGELERRKSPSSLLKNAFVTFFNLTKCGAKLRTEAQNNDLRRYFVIASMRCRNLLIKSTGC
jgi:hypothetical protein